MNAQELIDTAKTLVAGGKGLPAMDEGNPTCNKRFAGLGIPQTDEARRAYRECAGHVTTSNENEGFANAFDRFIPGTRPAPSASFGHG